MWTRSKRNFVLLFVVSSPIWWIFEWINRRTGNWEYIGGGHFTPIINKPEVAILGIGRWSLKAVVHEGKI